MARRNRLTNNTDETDIATLISGDNVFSIPFFQRPYKWKTSRLHQLQQDLLSLVEDASDFHFLGAIIVHGQRSNPSDPDVFEVIDGQQRVTTLFLYLCAAVKSLCELGEYAEAAGILLKYLVINRDTGSLSNFKMHSCKEDRAQLRYVYGDVLADATLKERLGSFVLKPLPSSGKESGILRNNYRFALRFLKDEVAQGGVERLRAIYGALLTKMSVVQIDVWDPTNGPKIFDSLNSRQEPMTIGDLVRNEIFSKISDRGTDELEIVDREHWQPFYQRFNQGGKNLFDAYFFPFGLIKDPNLKKSEVYSSLREQWQSTADPAEVILDLSRYQDAFIDIVCGTNISKLGGGAAKSLGRLHSTGLPSSILPYLMQLCRALTDKSVEEQSGIQIMNVLEGFLVRRALCGLEPTGLHAVFKRLWADCKGEHTAERVSREIAGHKTVPWPSDNDVQAAICKRPMYGASITKYFIREWDLSFKADCPSDIPWIEHVLPQKPAAGWYSLFTQAEYEECRDLMANLLPLSKQMNIELSNSTYDKKREFFLADSMFKSSRAFAETFSAWTPEFVKVRSQQLAVWATERWPQRSSDKQA